MTRRWAETGREVLDAEGLRAEVERAVDTMRWDRFDTRKTIGAMPGLFIGHAIKELRLPHPSAFAIHALMSGYALIGIESNWKNGRERRVFLDTGDGGVPIVSDFYPGERAEEPFLDTEHSFDEVRAERTNAYGVTTP